MGASIHVREEIAKCANEATEVIAGILDSIQEKEHIYRVSGTPSAFDMDEEDEDEDDFVTIPKEKYDGTIEDLLTMAELIAMVSDMRSKDVRAIQEFGKFIPAYAAYERNRLSLGKMSPTASLRRFTATTGSGGSNGGWISRLRRRGAA